jgi:hypothetical protein
LVVGGLAEGVVGASGAHAEGGVEVPANQELAAGALILFHGGFGVRELQMGFHIPILYMKEIRSSKSPIKYNGPSVVKAEDIAKDIPKLRTGAQVGDRVLLSNERDICEIAVSIDEGRGRGPHRRRA